MWQFGRLVGRTVRVKLTETDSLRWVEGQSGMEERGGGDGSWGGGGGRRLGGVFQASTEGYKFRTWFLIRIQLTVIYLLNTHFSNLISHTACKYMTAAWAQTSPCMYGSLRPKSTCVGTRQPESLACILLKGIKILKYVNFKPYNF